MKTISANLTTHIQGETTSLASFWKIKTRRGTSHTFTTHDMPKTYDIGDGDGAQIYQPTSSFNRSAISNSMDMAVDELEITGVLSSTDIDEDDLRDGLFDKATIWLFQANWRDTTQGIIRMRKGFLGDTTITRNGVFFAELRGLTQFYSQNFLELYSVECRADLGDVRCKIPILPDLLLRGQSVILNEFFFVPTTNLPAGYEGSLTNIVNQSFETDPVGRDGDTGHTGWTVFDGDATDWVIQNTAVTDGSQAMGFLVDNNNAGIRQDVELRSSMGGDLPDADLTTGELINIGVSVDGRATQSDSDRAELEIIALDSSDVEIATSGKNTTTSDTYVTLSVGLLLPAGTAKIRIELFLEDFGTVTGDFDNVVASFTNSSVQADPPLINQFEDRIYKVTTAGITAGVKPTYDTVVGNSTTDGTAILIAEEAWVRQFIVTDVNNNKVKKKFTVTELTPDTGGVTAGRDFFPDTSMDGGMVSFQTGNNTNESQEVRKFLNQFLSVMRVPGGNGAEDLGTYGGTPTIGANAVVQQAVTKFGPDALEFSPSSGSDTTSVVTYPDDAEIEIGSQMFTVQGWVRFKSLVLNDQIPFSKYNSSGNNRSWQIFRNAGNVGYSLSDDGTSSSPAFTVVGAFTPGWAIDTWYHFALCRDGSDDVRVFVDGIQYGATTAATFALDNNSQVLRLGGRGGGTGIDGFVEDFDFRLGEALYTANFTPPGKLVAEEQTLETYLSFPKAIVIGDTGFVYRGCFKRILEDCRDIFANAVNHHGEAYLPGRGKVFRPL